MKEERRMALSLLIGLGRFCWFVLLLPLVIPAVLAEMGGDPRIVDWMNRHGLVP